MNIRIYSPWKKLTNIWTNEYICLNIFEYILISEYLSHTVANCHQLYTVLLTNYNQLYWQTVISYTGKLSFSYTGKLSFIYTGKLSSVIYCLIDKLLSVMLANCHQLYWQTIIVILANCNLVILANCHLFILANCHLVILANCHSVMNCLTDKLSSVILAKRHQLYWQNII